MTGSSVTAADAGTLKIGDDLTVHRMGFGAMRLTGPGIIGEPSDREEAKRVLRRALELGVDFIDTADSYGPRVSEELIAETLYPYPSGLVIASKAGLLRGGPGVWQPDGRPAHLREALEGSLRALRVEQIELYQLHRPDPKVPFEESVGALAELQQRGLIRHIGVSNVDEEQLRRARMVAEIVSVQNRFNPMDRRWDAIVDVCERDGLAFLPWAPVGQGDVDFDAVIDIAGQRDASPQQVILAWLLRRSPAILPIPGTGSVQHLEDNIAAVGLELSHDELAALEGLRRKAA